MASDIINANHNNNNKQVDNNANHSMESDLYRGMSTCQVNKGNYVLLWE